MNPTQELTEALRASLVGSPEGTPKRSLRRMHRRSPHATLDKQLTETLRGNTPFDMSPPLVPLDVAGPSGQKKGSAFQANPGKDRALVDYLRRRRPDSPTGVSDTIPMRYVETPTDHQRPPVTCSRTGGTAHR